MKIAFVFLIVSLYVVCALAENAHDQEQVPSHTKRHHQMEHGYHSSRHGQHTAQRHGQAHAARHAHNAMISHAQHEHNKRDGEGIPDLESLLSDNMLSSVTMPSGCAQDTPETSTSEVPDTNSPNERHSKRSHHNRHGKSRSHRLM